MFYTTFQENLVRAELQKIHDYGLDHTSSRLTWRRVVEEVAAYTDLPLEISFTNDEQTSDLTKIKLNERHVKHLAERFRQFVMGPDKNDPSRTRRLSADTIKYVIEFLAHPEIGRLTPEQLASPDVALDAGARLAEFIWDGVKDNQVPFVEHYAEYFAPSVREGRKVAIRIAFQPTRMPNLFEIAEIAQISDQNASVDHGWAVLLPDDRISICIKNLKTNIAEIYDGHVQRGANSIYLLKQDFVKVVMMNQAPTMKISKFDLLFEFKYNINYKSGIFEKIDFEKLSFSNQNLYSNKNIFRMMDLKTKGKLLFEAIMNNDLNGFRTILDSGFDVNYREPESGFTALHEIAYLSRREFLRVIADQENVNYWAKDSQGRDPEFIAIQVRQDPVILRFISKKKRQQFTAQHALSMDDHAPAI